MWPEMSELNCVVEQSGRCHMPIQNKFEFPLCIQISSLAPSGVEIPACRHRSTLVFAKGTDGWKVVHFHNTTIDEAAVKGAAGLPKR